MRQLQPVIWAKGTFLTPQHLQLQDRFFESVLDFKLGALKYCPWGFAEMQFNHEALSAGSLALARAVGLFPDGLAFDIPDSDAAPGERRIEQSFGPDQTTLEVYLAVPQHRDRGLNVSVGQKSGDTRYQAEIELSRDENTGLAEKPVQVAKKNLRLLLEGEPLQGNTILRVGCVKKTETGLYQLDPQFIPPLLDISASEYLVAILRRLVEILAAKSSTLSGMRRQKNQSLAEFTAADIANFWLLYTANSYLPVMRHIFESKKGHPEGLYTTMLALAASLTTFSSTLQPRDLPNYDHDNLGACFTDLDGKLRMLLETVVPSNFVSIPLKLSRPSIYSAALANDKYLTNTRMYLAISADLSEADLLRRVPQLVKVCSATHIETLIRQALPAIPLTHVPSPPGSIPIKLNYQYFSLNQSGAAWEAVQRARNIAAYVPGDIPNPQLELIILLPQAE
ncbi:MAG: type VI secretion system baseplate subunit TssK [Terriglobia bacterium]|jgi:type VI secretion system protein ImpJ